MKYIKLFENYRSVDKYLKRSTFDNLPLDFKKGILTYTTTGEPVEWTYEGEITDWINGDNVNQAINDYSREMGDKEFLYGFVPKEVIIDEIKKWIEEEGDFKNFDHWYKWYQSCNRANHGSSYFPIIMDDRHFEPIEDGWHRFGYYLSIGLDEIPVVKFI